MFPSQESFGGRQEICGLHPLPAQAGPSRNQEIKGPTRTPGDTVQRPLPQPPVMLGLPVGRGEGLRASQRETRHFLDLAVRPATLGNRLGAPEAGSVTSGLVTGELGSHRGLRSHSR